MLQGRRRPDMFVGDLPDDIQPGDYWKQLNSDGTPRILLFEGKLTEECWYAAAPLPDGDYALGNLAHHTVREEDDGTISVRPGDGSSNSILVQKGANGPQYHGYIEHGVWT